jgi:hypothetical protein
MLFLFFLTPDHLSIFVFTAKYLLLIILIILIILRYLYLSILGLTQLGGLFVFVSSLLLEKPEKIWYGF